MNLTTIVAPSRKESSGPLPEHTSMFRRRSTIIFGAVIFLTMVAAVWLRWSGLSSQSLWADEGYTTWLAQFGPRVQWHLLYWDIQAPGYLIALHYWVAIWGRSEASFRALSAAASTLSLAVFYLIARRVWRSRLFVALGLLLCSFSFFQIWYAHEARMYAALGLLLLTSVYCMLLCLDKVSALRLLALAMALSAALYTHNMALFYLPGLVAFWFIYPSPMSYRVRLKNAAIVGAMVLVLYSPWLPTLVKQMNFVQVYYWAPKPTMSSLVNTLFTFNGLDVYVLQGLRNHLTIGRGFGMRTWTVMLFLTLFACMVGTWWRVGSIDRRKSVALQVYTFFPILLVFVWSRNSASVYVDRNLIGACALMPLILCAPLALQVGDRRRTFLIIVLAVLVGSVTSLSLHEQRKDDWRGVTEYLLKIPERQRLVVAFQPYCQIMVNYYATGLFKAYPRPEIGGLMTDLNRAPSGPDILPNLHTADPEAFLSRAIDTHRYKEIDVALQLERLPERVQAIPEFLRTHCASVEDVRFGNLGVSRCFVRQN